MWGILWHFREQGWHFRRQVQLDRYYVDFACLGAKLIIEVDGDTHGTDAAIRRDAERDEYLRSHGFMVVRYANADVMSNPDGIFTHLSGVLDAVSRASNTPAEPAAPSSPSPLRGGDRGGGTS